MEWLLEGDVAIQYQVYKDLLGIDRKDLQNKIATQGWGLQFLSQRKSAGHWGDRFYQPKWISTHYTLLDLRNLNLSPNNKVVKASINLVLGMIAVFPFSSIQEELWAINGHPDVFLLSHAIQSNSSVPIMQFYNTLNDS